MIACGDFYTVLIFLHRRCVLPFTSHQPIGASWQVPHLTAPYYLCPPLLFCSLVCALAPLAQICLLNLFPLLFSSAQWGVVAGTALAIERLCVSHPPPHFYA